MKTLSQIRAENALNASRTPGMGVGQKGGDALSGFPMLIRGDGLLAAGAFAVELNSHHEPKHEGERLIFSAIAIHLSSEGVAVCQATTARDLVEELASDHDSSQLRHATSEALAFLSYLKRFVV